MPRFLRGVDAVDLHFRHPGAYVDDQADDRPRGKDASQPASLRAQAQRLARESDALLDQAARLEARPPDDFEVGSVLTWAKTFGGPKVYHYVAIKVGPDWYISGSRTGGFKSWHSLLDLVEREGGTVDGLWFAAALDEVPL